ncbi:hypothetical protein ACP3DM_001152 [Enterococcus faecium]
MRDVDDADYYHLLSLYGKSSSDDYMDGADFIKQFLSAEDLVKLEEGGK